MKTKRSKALQRDPKNSGVLTVFIDGAGCRPDGTGSGFAWICTTTKEKAIERIPNLTNNQAEYRALIAALEGLPPGAHVDLYSDSQLLCCQFNGRFSAKDPALTDLLAQAQSLVKQKRLQVPVQWVSRTRNPAGKLL
jgi:ribonuclease HI